MYVHVTGLTSVSYLKKTHPFSLTDSRGLVLKFCSELYFRLADFRHALVLEPNNKRAAQTLDRLRKLFL